MLKGVIKTITEEQNATKTIINQKGTNMVEKEFNLQKEPWVRVLTLDGEIKEVSLSDALPGNIRGSPFMIDTHKPTSITKDTENKIFPNNTLLR